MSAINSNNRLKNQHSSMSRLLPFSDEYRKLKKVLLKSMFGLLSKAEVSARNAIGIQTIQSIQQCKEWLADCLESLQQTKQDLVKNESVSTNIEFDSNDTNTGRKYIVSLKKLIHSYKRYRYTRRPKAHKMKMKKKFKEILTENIEGLRFVIKMMEVFIRKAKKNLMKEKKEIWNTLGVQALRKFKIEQKQRKSIRDSIFGDENEKEWPSTTKNHRRPHHKKIIKEIKTESHELDQPIIIPKRKKETASIEKLSITSLDKAIHTGKKLLTRQSFTKAPVSADQVNLFTMQKAASFIIHNLFANKISPFEKIIENRVDLRHGDDPLDEIWRELISEHNRLVSIPGKRTLSEIKDDLTTFYLNKMQLAFLDQLTSNEEKSSRGFGHALRSNKSFVLDIKQMPLGNAAIHEMLYDAQMKKLRSGRYNPDIQRMLKIIMSEGLPKSRSSHELLKLYKSDPQHFNVLLMSCAHNITHRGASLLKFIEHKFERVKEQLARQRRRIELIQSSASYRISDPINSADKCGSLSHRTEFVLDDEYCKEVRERWSKYFAEQEKTPTMLHLEEERRKKTECFLKLKEERRLQKLEKANNLKKKDMRPITALYTSPRLTHRTRKAIDRLAEEAPLFPMVNENLNKFEQNIRPIPSVTSIGEYETGPTLADIILDSQSMTSCCSKCCNQADAVHYGPVLERFFRTHDEIIAHGNNVCNSSDFSDEDSDFCGVQYQE